MTTLYPKLRGNLLPNTPSTFKVAIAFFRGTEILLSAPPCSWASLSTEMRWVPSGNSRNGPGKKCGDRHERRDGEKSHDSHLGPQCPPSHPHRSWTEIKRQVRDPPHTPLLGPPPSPARSHFFLKWPLLSSPVLVTSVTSTHIRSLSP